MGKMYEKFRAYPKYSGISQFLDLQWRKPIRRMACTVTKGKSLSKGPSKSSQTTAVSGGIDLVNLGTMHPRLPVDMTGLMLVRAALGLQRNGHAPGAVLHLSV